jgi:hypothetical protein
MSKSGDVFAESILDAENLLQHFNTLNTQPPPPELEVLKRAGLIMAMTAWETYVEDRVSEALGERLASIADGSIASLLEHKLAEEIKRLHNPTSQKTITLFRDYGGVDLTERWSWNNVDATSARERLDSYIRLRGDVVHRSRPISRGTPVAHPVTKIELEKAVKFLKCLVQATESALVRATSCAGSVPVSSVMKGT